MSDTVTVKIDMTARVRYVGDVKMARSTFDEVDRRLDAGGADRRRAETFLLECLDESLHWCDSDADSVDTFEVVNTDTD